jgi:hypothetical protein
MAEEILKQEDDEPDTTKKEEVAVPKEEPAPSKAKTKPVKAEAKAEPVAKPEDAAAAMGMPPQMASMMQGMMAPQMMGGQMPQNMTPEQQSMYQQQMIYMQQQTINNLWKQVFEMQIQQQLNGGAPPTGATPGQPAMPFAMPNMMMPG